MEKKKIEKLMEAGDYALLHWDKGVVQDFVIAYKYDPEKQEWASGKYFAATKTDPNLEKVKQDAQRAFCIKTMEEIDGGQIDFTKFGWNDLRNAKEEFSIRNRMDFIEDYLNYEQPALCELLSKDSLRKVATDMNEWINDNDALGETICQAEQIYLEDIYLPDVQEEYENKHKEVFHCSPSWKFFLGYILTSRVDVSKNVVGCKYINYEFAKRKELIMSYGNTVRQAPLSIFVSGVGQYNEGELTGKWLDLPASKEEWVDALAAAGIGDKDSFGYTYEESFITDWIINCPALTQCVGEYSDLESLQILAEKIEEMNKSEYDAFCTYAQVSSDVQNISNVYSVAEQSDVVEDCVRVYPDATDYDSLGEYLIEEFDYPTDSLDYYFDYEKLGRDLDFDEYEIENYLDYEEYLKGEFEGDVWFSELDSNTPIDFEDAVKNMEVSIHLEKSGVEPFVIKIDEFYDADDLSKRLLEPDSQELKNQINELSDKQKVLLKDFSWSIEEFDPDEQFRYANAGEYFCGDKYASDSDIGYACVDDCGIDSLTNPEYYFDCEKFGRDFTFETFGEFTDDGYVEIVDSVSIGNELEEDLKERRENEETVVPSVKEMEKYFAQKVQEQNKCRPKGLHLDNLQRSSLDVSKDER